MIDTYYQEFSNLTGIVLIAVQEDHGNVAEATLLIYSSIGGTHELTFLRPRGY